MINIFYLFGLQFNFLLIHRTTATRLKDHNTNLNNQEIDVIKHVLDNPNYNIDFINITILSTARM